MESYALPTMMTSGGRHAALLEALPNDVAALCRIVQGMAIHEYMARAYGVTVPDERKGESHIRPVERMLDRMLDIDPQPLALIRPPERRLVGVCRHFITGARPRPVGFSSTRSWTRFGAEN